MEFTLEHSIHTPLNPPRGELKDEQLVLSSVHDMHIKNIGHKT